MARILCRRRETIRRGSDKEMATSTSRPWTISWRIWATAAETLMRSKGSISRCRKSANKVCSTTTRRSGASQIQCTPKRRPVSTKANRMTSWTTWDRTTPREVPFRAKSRFSTKCNKLSKSLRMELKSACPCSTRTRCARARPPRSRCSTVNCCERPIRQIVTALAILRTRGIRVTYMKLYREWAADLTRKEHCPVALGSNSHLIMKRKLILQICSTSQKVKLRTRVTSVLVKGWTNA